MTILPSGTVTFLFTDIEGSTKLAREHPETWEIARARHHIILRGAIEANQGYVFQIIRDAFWAAFPTAAEAVKAAIQAQQGLQNEPALFKEVLNLFREEANQYGMRGCLLGFAGLLAVSSKPREAARLFGAVESLLEDIGMAATRDPLDQKEFNHYLAIIHTELGEATFATAWTEGHTMTLEQAIEFALKKTEA